MRDTLSRDLKKMEKDDRRVCSREQFRYLGSFFFLSITHRRTDGE